MESPERLSADPSNSRRGPNPNRDYKQHFLRQKQRFDTVTSEQVNHKRELSRASLKQMKLQDEIEFIIDAIAEQRRKRSIAPTQISPSSPPLREERLRTSETAEKEDVKPALTSNGKEARRENVSQVDDDLEDLVTDDQDDQDVDNNANDDSEVFATPISTRSSGRTRIPSAAANAASTSTGPKAITASTGGSNKRPRRFTYSDDDDDDDDEADILLQEAAGLRSKRARNE